MNFKKKLFLAPMAGVTNVPFRELCRNYGADAVVTEMISINALIRNSKPTLKLLQHSKEESPVGVQLFGGKPEFVSKAAKMVEKDFDWVDFNFGCPAKKILKQGAGSALMKRPARVKEIVEALRVVNKPVTVKIRSGWDKASINAVEIAQISQDAGADAIFIHARTTSQGYSGKADWNVIKNVKKAVKIPVIGNGDVFSALDAMSMYYETKCDSVMVGRGALGNPFIFKEIKKLLKTGKEIKPANLGERIKVFLTIQQRFNFNDMKAQALYFIKDFKDAASLRMKISRMKARPDIVNALKIVSNIK
jgi:tRNA-dihydrouridine synthase B